MSAAAVRQLAGSVRDVKTVADAYTSSPMLSAEREEYSWIHWFQEPPGVLIDRVQKAMALMERYSCNRLNQNEVLVYRGDGDVLRVKASSDEAGTRLEITGRSEPDVIDEIRTALA